MARKRTPREQPGATTPQRIDELLWRASGAAARPDEVDYDPSVWASGLHEPGVLRIERLLSPAAAARVYRHVGGLIVRHGQASMWELFPPDQLAFQAVNPHTIDQIVDEVPGFVDLPRDQLEAVLRTHAAPTSREPLAAASRRLGVDTPLDEAPAAVRLYINEMRQLKNERRALLDTLAAITGGQLTLGQYFIPLGFASPEAQKNAAAIDALREWTQGGGSTGIPLPLESVSLYYPTDGSRAPL